MAKRKKKKRLSGFAVGMITYVLLFVLVAVLGLVFLNSFLENYEATRPANVMARYMEGLTDSDIERMAQPFVDALNADLTDRDALRALCIDMVRGAEYKKKVAECTETKTVYVLKNEDGAFGKVSFTLGDNVFHGLLANWQVSGAQIDLSDYCGTFDVTVPADYSVSLNGYTLDERYISEEKVEYAALQEYYGEYELPYMVSYHADGFIGEPELLVRDADGQTVDAAQLNESAYTDNCSPEKKAELTAFTKEFVTAYMTYTSNSNGLSGVNYSRLIPMIVWDSELHYRVEQAIGGLSFTAYHEDTLKDIRINTLMDVGEMIFCDVTYDVSTLSGAGVTEFSNNAKLLIVHNEGKYQVLAMESY